MSDPRRQDRLTTPGPTRPTAAAPRSAAPRSAADRSAATTPPPGLALPVRAGLLAAGVLAAAVVVLLLGLSVGGGLAPSALGDPGDLVRYGLPVARAVHDLAAALAVGGFVVASVLLPHPSAAWTRAVRVAGVSAGVWTVAALLVLVLTAMDVVGAAPGAPGFGAQFAQFAQEIDLGRALLVTTVLAAVVATVGAATATPTGAAAGAVLALVALLPLSLSGHASGSASHQTAVSSLAMHLIGVTVWIGGLAVVLLVAPLTGRRPGGGAKGERVVDLTVLASRYSTVALWSFVAVAVSGVLNAAVRLGGWSGLDSSYGALVVAKVVALVVLGAFGVWHRRRTLPLLATRPWAFGRIAAGELVLMGAATGLGVALSRSPTPVPDDNPASSVAETMLGEPAPPSFTVGRWFTQTSPDLLWIVITGLLLVGYLLGVRRMRRRGDSWPVGRTIWWVAGCLALAFVTSGGPAAYGRVAFSTHMLQHMLLTMAVPPLLVLGAPVTLAMRTLTTRRDGSRGAREWLMVVVHSRYLAIVGHPVVAAVLFAGSLIVFYYSPLFELALRTHVGHELMMVHFLGTGYLFSSALIGVDPGANRPAYPLRLILLLATMAFHAFFGVSLMQGTHLLAPDWFGRLDPSANLLADQQEGGDIAWGIGEVPTLVLVLGVAVAWSRSDTRENRRHDRAAARNGDKDLNEYNAMLTRLAERDGTGSRQSSRGADSTPE